MKIVTKLKIFGTFAIVLVIILGAIIYWRANQVDLAIEKDRVSSGLVKEAFVLNILSGDYIQTHGERARIQWMSQFRNLSRSTNSYLIENPEEQRILDKLRLTQKATLLHFSHLQSNTEEEKLQKNDEFERRLSGQLSVDVQEIVALATRLSDINSKKLTSVRQATSFYMFIVIFLLGLLFIFTYSLLAGSISRSIRRLIDGTKILAGGNLNFRYEIRKKDEFGQLALAFNEMTSSLQKLDKIKTEFIYLVSHELRTPVGAIKGFMSMINSGDYGKRTKELERPLYLITSSVDKILHIVNEMLDVSRIQSDKVLLNSSSFDIQDLIDESVSSNKFLTAGKDIEIKIKKCNVIVYADKDKVAQILNNLVENAFKFTEKGTITISTNKTDEMLVISISDTGIGIDKKYQINLFEKFNQIKLEQAGKTSGIGLGLYISREFAQRMGGDLWVDKSEIGKGSTFVFSLPMRNPNNKNTS